VGNIDGTGADHGVSCSDRSEVYEITSP
jgi:hypothetical protein